MQQVAQWISEEDVWTFAPVGVGGRASRKLSAGRITLRQLNKSVSELTAAVKRSRPYCRRSMTEIERLDAIASEAGIRMSCASHRRCRAPTVHLHRTGPEIRVIGGQRREPWQRSARFATDALRLVGLFGHIGSQIFDVDGFNSPRTVSSACYATSSASSVPDRDRRSRWRPR